MSGADLSPRTCPHCGDVFEANRFNLGQFGRRADPNPALLERRAWRNYQAHVDRCGVACPRERAQLAAARRRKRSAGLD